MSLNKVHPHPSDNGSEAKARSLSAGESDRDNESWLADGMEQGEETQTNNNSERLPPRKLPQLRGGPKSPKRLGTPRRAPVRRLPPPPGRADGSTLRSPSSALGANTFLHYQKQQKQQQQQQMGFGGSKQADDGSPRVHGTDATTTNAAGASDQQQQQQLLQQQQQEMLIVMQEYELWRQMQAHQHQHQHQHGGQGQRGSAIIGERWREGRLGKWGEDDTGNNRAAYLHMKAWKAQHKVLADRGTNDTDSGTVGSADEEHDADTDGGGDGDDGCGAGGSGDGDGTPTSSTKESDGVGNNVQRRGHRRHQQKQKQKLAIVPMEADDDTAGLVARFHRPPINVSLHQGWKASMVQLKWHFLFIAFAVVYLLCGCMSAFLLLGVNGDLSSASGLADNLTTWETVAWSSYSNLLGAGNGDLVPTTSFAYFLCNSVQFLGIVLNGVFAAAVLYKFLHPRIDFAFSQNAAVTLKHVDIVVEALYHKTTTEGEHVVVRVPLQTTTSAVHHGALTVAHSLTARSPLNGLNKKSALTGSKYEGLTIAVQIKDGVNGMVYPASTGKVYRAHTIMVGRCMFSDLADLHHGCCDHVFNYTHFNLITPLPTKRLHKPLAFHLGSSQTVSSSHYDGSNHLGSSQTVSSSHYDGSNHLGSSQTVSSSHYDGSNGGDVDDGGGNGDGDADGAQAKHRSAREKLASHTAPQTYATRGLYLQGPRRYWRRFMDE